MEPQDIIVACEIIEHLYTSPNYVLPFIKTCVKPNGYVIIQTPNAVSLKHRLVMLAGKNPYELIRETLDNPGHFREYTKTEMTEYAAAHGFELVDYGCYSYFNYVNHGWVGHAYKFLSAVLPNSLRDNMTLVFRRNA
ncbi:MAG: methyltransferase domain-containing protein [Rhizobacter sp.]|nr:methyltransferase domain-containing protein [Chlorobiales bacterium]